jgi:hypothetical protein
LINVSECSGFFFLSFFCCHEAHHVSATAHWDKAREYFSRALEVYRGQFGDEHVFVADSQWYLGCIHMNQGKEALSLFLRTNFHTHSM